MLQINSIDQSFYVVDMSTLSIAQSVSVLVLGYLQLLGQLGNSGEEISNETIVSNLEDGCFRVLVDRNNGLGILHTGQVLDGTRDTHSNVAIMKWDEM